MNQSSLPLWRRVATKLLFSATIAVVALAATTVLHAAAVLSAADQQFLIAYVKVHDALIANDFPGTIKAAGTFPDGSGAGVAKAGSLSAARDEFAKLAPRAEKLAAGQPGYHVFYCPMAKKDWVQTGTTIANPYLGSDMLACGVEKQ